MRENTLTEHIALPEARVATGEKGLFAELVRALRMALLTLLLTGLAYPLAMTGLSQLLFPHQANGSLLRDASGKVVGSELLAQGFVGPAYFHPRPSAAGEKGYDPLASGGSNLGPTSKKLREPGGGRARGAPNGESGGEWPPAGRARRRLGGSLDPHLSPPGRAFQVARVARARGVAKSRVEALLGGTEMERARESLCVWGSRGRTSST